MRAYSVAWLLLVAAMPTPGRTRHLNCAAVRAALARGQSPPEVAVEFHTSTRLVNECQQEKNRHQHGFRLMESPTPIPERTDIPTPFFPTPERPNRFP